MQGIRDAIRYGVETLKVSPDRLFGLIESSRDYTGEDYQRWLANQIIRVAEDRGVGYSQLLVKRFDITRDLIEEVEDESSIREECISFIHSLMSKSQRSIYSINMEELGEPIGEDFDWFSKLDYGLGISDFYDALPEAVKEDIESSEEFNLCARLSRAKSNPKCDLFLDAKSRGIQCKTEGALILYRACMLADSLTMRGINVSITFVADDSFLSAEENKELIDYFLECFTYNGVVLNNSDFLVNAFVGGRKAICVCTSRVSENGSIQELQDGFVLPVGHLDGETFVQEATQRFSSSSKLMLNFLRDTYPCAGSQVPIEKEGKVSTLGEGVSEALGYLCFSKIGTKMELSTVPQQGMVCVPILEENLFHIIAYYGIVKSMEQFGLSRDIPMLIDGHNKFEELVYNCLPLFLFDVDSNFKTFGVLRINGGMYPCINKFAINRPEVIQLIEKAEVFFSFEAKELYTLCSGFITHLMEEDSEENSHLKQCSFKELRQKYYDDDLTAMYMQSLTHLKDQICSLYRSMC